MKINRHNYESYFLDYIEGNLSKDDIRQLYLFLAQNPDLEEGIKNFENITLNGENVHYSNKQNLKYDKIDLKTDINESNYYYFIIAKHENDLTATKEKELSDFLKTHPEKQKGIDFFSMVLQVRVVSFERCNPFQKLSLLCKQP